MKNIKVYSLFFCLLIIHQLLIIFVQSILHPIHFTPQNFFVLELIGREGGIPSNLLFILNAGNVILLWLISKRIFANRFSLIPPIVYAISPWSAYLVAAESFYIYLSFLVLLISYGLFLIRLNQQFWGTILVVVAMTVSVYSSLLLLIILPFFLPLLVYFGLMPFSKIKRLAILLIILALPMLFYIYGNLPGFKNSFNNEVRVFSDPGLLNMVNNYQGTANKEGLGKFAKLSENRYIFSAEYILLKFVKQFTPSTFFTSQEKLLNFSFSSPIYLGFIIPFIFGLYRILQSSMLRRILYVSSLLVIPSMFAKQAVDLNRLVIIAPMIVLVISYGLEELYVHRENKIAKLFLVTALSLVVFQTLLTFDDIRAKEKDRFVKYFEQNFEIGKQ